MDSSDVNMAGDSDAAPASPPAAPTPPLPPPPPPLLLPAPAPVTPAPPPALPALPALASVVGSLESATRSALRQDKWPLVLLLPARGPRSAPSSPAPARPAWGPDAYHAPKKLHAPARLVDSVLLWRRTASSSDAERYTAFFPADGLPHLALLDPRSGERLAVWGNVQGQGMDADGIADSLWETVQNDLLHFLNHHSLEDGALGPTHRQEKSWAVRTRRVAPSSSKPPLRPTSVMDDEEAAIAAAIAASLAENNNKQPYFPDTASDDDHEHEEDDDDDDDEDDMFSGHTSSQEEDDGNDTNTLSDDFDHSSKDSAMSSPQGVAVDMSPNVGDIPPPPRRPMLIPSRADPIPSSVESVSSSYLERMDSCFRSSTNTQLMETRKLRQEQDAELAASLQEDKQREQQERAEGQRKAARKQAIIDAAARLPDEPAESAKAAFTIAIRLPLGKRIVRRFNSFDTLQSVADFAVAESGCISVYDTTPEASLKISGVKLASASWGTAIADLNLGKKTMIILNE